MHGPVRSFTLALLAATALAEAPLAAPSATAQTPNREERNAFQATTLNLSAYGESRVAPDMATITLGVSTQSTTAAESMRQNRARMATVVAALKAQGVAERDIQTSGLTLNAQYAYEQNQPPRLTGYQASNEVTITVRNLAGLGGAVDALVKAGANQVNGISFGLQNPQSAEDEARRAAVKALTAKAGLYAEATGYRVARLVNLSEGGGYAPSPPRPLMAMAKMAEPQTPVEPGELRVRIDISGVYELGR